MKVAPTLIRLDSEYKGSLYTATVLTCGITVYTLYREDIHNGGVTPRILKPSLSYSAQGRHRYSVVRLGKGP